MACTLTSVSACSDSEPSNKLSATPPVSEPATEAPAPTPTNIADQTKSQLIHLYENYWAQMERAYATGTIKGTDLEKYAAAVALVKAEQNVTNHSKEGRVTTGAVSVNNAMVTKIDLSRKVPSATLSSCLDISKWDLIDQKTKKKVPLPEGRRTRYVVTTTVEKWPEGWRVIKDEPQDLAC
ncbi:hypothetical protein [Streptomyces sp. NPDC056524]|uniref:hypothetical protein n=1 Tax=Streptomyces sp. NPDC056524 TaxID=3345851 RepID=UPI00369E3E4D